MSRGLASLAFVAVLVGVAAAQGPPRLVIESMTGQDLFRFYCAPCHGTDGKGHGPVAAALTTVPADLTTIAARNGGRFPRATVRSYISADTRSIAAHGSADMPIWGRIFLGLDGSRARTDVRMDNLVSYLESLQKR